MTIRNKNKDHLGENASAVLVEPALAPRSDDPLRFWSDHPTENFLVDLHVFSKGEHEYPGRGAWAGPFSGRPELIAELAPAITAKLTLAPEKTCKNVLFALRSFWRIIDEVDSASASASASDGKPSARLTSVRDLNHLHEAAAHRAAIDATRFSYFLTIANDARRLLRLPALVWATPKGSEPIRSLIPDDHAKAIRIAIKRDWQKVMSDWDRNDAVRRGEHLNTHQDDILPDSSPAQEHFAQSKLLHDNWAHFAKTQQATGLLLPTTTQLFDGLDKDAMRRRQGITAATMRAIQFPTVEEADIAFHMALAGSGWNPSTLITGIDATASERVFQHPKDQKQTVLVVEDQEADGTGLEEVSMQGNKRRAGGRIQFCMGLKKNPASPPNIVAKYMQRTEALREKLLQDCDSARNDLAQLHEAGAPAAEIERQFIRFQNLQQGVRNVWLYVGQDGEIKWLDGKHWARYRSAGDLPRESYLDRVIGRLNADRTSRDEPAIARIVPSDFRDIYARWVHIQTGGNIIAVMHALGHSSLRSTGKYVDNNIFNAESDTAVERFMSHLFAELEQGRVDLTILAQLVRHGSLTNEMHARLKEYRALTRSRIKVACADPSHPPPHVAPDHIEGRWCGTHRCLRDCKHARFLPESLDGIAMRIEELLALSDTMPTETWVLGEFDKEIEAAEFLLTELYPRDESSAARAQWRQKIESGDHLVRGAGFIRTKVVA